MLGHLRANLWLLGLTLVLCCVVYPLVLWGIGQTAFHDRAEGSLITGPNGKPIGSRLIAQPFKADEYFQPRPSAVSYNAAASGASNWSASNPLLRDRVARALGSMARYRGSRHPVGPDVEKWFQQQAPDFVDRWAKEHPMLGQQWVKDNPEAVALWLHKEVDAVKDKPDEAAAAFFESYAKKNPGTWPTVSETKSPDGRTIKQVQPAREGSDIQSYLFDVWLQAHPDADIEEVPADLVTTSGSGLDPHITLKGALYQLDRVAAAWTKRSGRAEEAVRKEIASLLEEKSFAPLGGLVGVKLVNVLEVNIGLRDKYGSPAPASK
jgi:K+-transporting ATPase ATPase C chain